jgi:hypothetical protein
MTCSCGFKLLAVPCAVALLLGGFVPAFATDAGPYASQPANGWQFSFTPYGWATSINGNATARGHTVD